MAKAGSGKMMKGFVAGMLFACLAASGCAWYFYELSDLSVSEMAANHGTLLTNIKKIKSASESLQAYYELKGGADGKASTETRNIDDIIGELNDLFSKTYNINTAKFKNSDESPPADPKKDFQRHAVKIHLFAETRSRYENMLLKIHDDYGDFAVIESLDIMPGKKKPDLAKSVEENSLEWEVIVDLVWYTQTPAGADKPANPS